MVQESPSSDFSSGATLATAFDIHNATYFRQPGCVRPGNTDVLVEGYSFLNYNNLDNGEESLLGNFMKLNTWSHVLVYLLIMDSRTNLG